MSYGPRIKKRAFELWLDCRNLDKTLRDLHKEYPELKLSRPTLKNWHDESGSEGDGWQARADRLDQAELKFGEEFQGVESNLLRELCNISKRYTAKFSDLIDKKPPDSQDVYAFIKVGKLIADIVANRRRAEGPKTPEPPDEEEVTRRAEEILESEYGIKPKKKD